MTNENYTKHPLVSVIIPTYNRPHTIKRAIKSVVNQTYKNIELIVVDDNAKNTDARIKTKKIVSKYSNAKYIINNKNLGGSRTRNVGIKAARGKYVAFLDDDDEFLPTKIAEQIDLMEQKQSEDKNTCIIYCYQNSIQINGKSKVKKANHEGNALYEHILKFTMPTSTWLCDKEKLLKIGGFDDMPSQQDLALMLKVLDNGYSIYRVPKALLNFYVHKPGDGITKTGKDFVEQVKCYHRLCRQSFSKLNKKQIDKIEHNFHNRLCNCYIQMHDYANAKKELNTMFRSRPFEISNYKNLIKITIK